MKPVCLSLKMVSFQATFLVGLFHGRCNLPSPEEIKSVQPRMKSHHETSRGRCYDLIKFFRQKMEKMLVILTQIIVI
jgi:hypothetical protein